jgi:ABC-type phosphate/phosphonate transport system ATPase subunit
MNNVLTLCNKVDSDKQLIKMKILNVAEKNDAAKNLAGYLSGGNLRRVSIIIPNLTNRKSHNI